MMYLHRKDVKLIGEIMDEFPEAQSFRLDSEEGGGIGTTLKLTVTTEIAGRPADVTFEIAGVEDW
jgi:hypothetical protein